jgi:hypothetical protein
MISQPSTASWRLASRLTVPFRGMLLTRTERPVSLSPKGSWGACTPQGEYSHSITAPHGALPRSGMGLSPQYLGSSPLLVSHLLSRGSSQDARPSVRNTGPLIALSFMRFRRGIWSADYGQFDPAGSWHQQASSSPVIRAAMPMTIPQRDGRLHPPQAIGKQDTGLLDPLQPWAASGLLKNLPRHGERPLPRDRRPRSSCRSHLSEAHRAD